MIIALTILGLATSAQASPPDEQVAVPALAKALEAYEQAQMKGDRAALEQLLASDYMLVSSNGGREGKAEFIADLTAPDFKLQPYAIQAHVLRTWSGGAVSAGVARQTGTSGGQAFDECIRYADTWKLEHGAWRVVFTQVARAPTPGPEGCKAP